MTEPKPDINETAVAISSALVGHPPATVYRWIDTAVSGTKPLPGYLQHDAWIAYRAAVVGYDRGYNDCIERHDLHLRDNL